MKNLVSTISKAINDNNYIPIFNLSLTLKDRDLEEFYKFIFSLKNFNSDLFIDWILNNNQSGLIDFINTYSIFDPELEKIKRALDSMELNIRSSFYQILSQDYGYKNKQKSFQFDEQEDVIIYDYIIVKDYFNNIHTINGQLIKNRRPFLTTTEDAYKIYSENLTFETVKIFDPFEYINDFRGKHYFINLREYNLRTQIDKKYETTTIGNISKNITNEIDLLVYKKYKQYLSGMEINEGQNF